MVKEAEQQIINIIPKQVFAKANSLAVEIESDNDCKKSRRGVEDVLLSELEKCKCRMKIRGISKRERMRRLMLITYTIIYASINYDAFNIHGMDYL